MASTTTLRREAHASRFMGRPLRRTVPMRRAVSEIIPEKGRTGSGFLAMIFSMKPSSPKHVGPKRGQSPQDKGTVPFLAQHAGRIVRGLIRLYPEAKCSLDYQDPLQLLVATILSAQCTDVRVNQVTPTLFARYPDAKAFAEAKSAELEKLIQSTGFYRNKARNILACCRRLVDEHEGN